MAGDISNSVAAGYGLMVMHAMDMYRVDITDPVPAFAAALSNDGWLPVGWIVGTDHLPVKNGPIKLGGPVCYGYVVQRGDEFVAAIRGTDQFVEWVEDAEFLPDVYGPVEPPGAPPGGKVEAGFWSIYRSMVLRRKGEADAMLPQALEKLVLGSRTITVTGHSLGGPLATYLTLDLARGVLGDRVSGCFFASPHPGNQVFAAYFDQVVKNYRVFNYILDVVPRVPSGPDYTHLPKRTVLRPGTAEACITLSVGCNHHVICYSAMLDYALSKPFVDRPPDVEADSAKCVVGPEVGRPTLAKLLLSGIGDVIQV